MSKEEFLKIQTFDLKVNMNCDGCEEKVKKILQQIDGVCTIKIDSVQGKVTVTGIVEPHTLIKKLQKSKKHAELWGPPKGNQNQQQQLNNQMKNLQMDNGKGGNNKAQKGGGGNNQQRQQPKGGQQGQIQIQNQNQSQQQLQLPPFGKDQNQKAVKFILPMEEDDLSDDEFDEFDDDFDDDYDDFDGDFDDDELGDAYQHVMNSKMKAMMNNGQMPNLMAMNGKQLPQVVNAQAARAGIDGNNGGNGKKGGGGRGSVPVQVSDGEHGNGGKKGRGGNEGNNQNQGRGGRKNGGKGGSGQPSEAKSGDNVVPKRTDRAYKQTKPEEMFDITYLDRADNKSAPKKPSREPVSKTTKTVKSPTQSSGPQKPSSNPSTQKEVIQLPSCLQTEASSHQSFLTSRDAAWQKLQGIVADEDLSLFRGLQSAELVDDMKHDLFSIMVKFYAVSRRLADEEKATAIARVENEKVIRDQQKTIKENNKLKIECASLLKKLVEEKALKVEVEREIEKLTEELQNAENSAIENFKNTDDFQALIMPVFLQGFEHCKKKFATSFPHLDISKIKPGKAAAKEEEENESHDEAGDEVVAEEHAQDNVQATETIESNV